ncbi:MAG: membrane dipeptidase [Candidatus Zixiibacteriota bacterium]
MPVERKRRERNESAAADISRRNFLGDSLRALAGAALPWPLLWLDGCTHPPLLTDRTIPRVLADLHVHAGINRWNRQTPLGLQYPAVAKLAEVTFNRSGMDWKDCYEAGVDLICATHFNVFDEWLSMPTDPDPDAPAHTLRMLDLLEEELQTTAAPYAKLATTPKQLDALLDTPKESLEWRVAVIHTVEGGHALGGRLYAVEPLARRGVAMIGLTHFFNKGVATSGNSYPFFPDANSPWPALGLSEFGRDLIKEVERCGVIVDVIHATNTALEDIFKVATRPMVASHSSARTLGDHPYSLIDEHLEEIARRGGLLGIILDPYLLGNYATLFDAEKEGTLRDVVRTVGYLVKLIGHEHVAIGTDFGGYITPPKDMTRVQQIGRLHRLLLHEFGDPNLVTDILANNAIRFIMANWKPLV